MEKVQFKSIIYSIECHQVLQHCYSATAITWLKVLRYSPGLEDDPEPGVGEAGEPLERVAGLGDLDNLLLVSGAVQEALQDAHLAVLVQRDGVHVLVLGTNELFPSYY